MDVAFSTRRRLRHIAGDLKVDQSGESFGKIASFAVLPGATKNHPSFAKD
jgi:hypothetical protein